LLHTCLSLKITMADVLIKMYYGRDCLAMSKTVEHMKECDVHIHELEKENLDLHQKMNVDKKTLTALRQVCTNESTKLCRFVMCSGNIIGNYCLLESSVIMTCSMSMKLSSTYYTVPSQHRCLYVQYSVKYSVLSSHY